MRAGTPGDHRNEEQNKTTPNALLVVQLDGLAAVFGEEDGVALLDGEGDDVS
jgi:hypothetical protein